MSAIDIVKEPDSRVFLQKIMETPYPLSEKILDIITRCAALSGLTFKSCLMLPQIINTIGLIFSSSDLSHFINITQKSPEEAAKELKTLAKEYLEDIDEKELITKLTATKATLKNLAEKMGIGNVDLYIDPATGDNGSVEKCTSRIVILGAGCFCKSQEQINYTLAHELSHHKNLDLLKKIFMNCFCPAITPILFAFLPFRRFLCAMVVINGLAAYIFPQLWKQVERSADRDALRYLNTSAGMIKDYREALTGYYLLKHLPIEETLQASKLQTTYDEVKVLQFQYTPYGNDRLDSLHHSITERLAFALDFKPFSQNIDAT